MKDRNPLAYALRRLRGIFRPSVQILPPPQGVCFDRDIEVAVRDGTRLRVNVFRPQAEGRYPVLLCAHPYRKDDLPKSHGRGFRTPFQYRLLRQTSDFQH
ncbi:CocE/NonD family hydrolase, partial [Haliangium sp. UPWRP_2]|uniref:CocE/NonD family hydrolase n=1 Tax=Haliangium sp. UPWRP_2 TaxID=1931276 RepID=UPI0018ECCF05